MAKNVFWQITCAFATAPVALVASTAHGAYKSLSGKGSFSEGYFETMNPMMDKAIEFGEENGEHLTRFATSMGGRMAGDYIHDHLKPKNPNT